jgi:hypothetical protein
MPGGTPLPVLPFCVLPIPAHGRRRYYRGAQQGTGCHASTNNQVPLARGSAGFGGVAKRSDLNELDVPEWAELALDKVE